MMAENQDTATEIKRILAAAKPEQTRWVIARLVSRTDLEAAKAVRVCPETVCRWPNKEELDRCVALLLAEKALAARTILEDSTMDAAFALQAALGDSRSRVQAAVAILDRAGLTPQQKVDVTTGGLPLTDDARTILERKLSAFVAAGAAGQVPAGTEPE